MIRGNGEARGGEDPEHPWTVLARHPDFRRLFTGNAVSLLGSSVTTVALPLTAVLYLDASATEMGLIGALGLLPHLVLGLPAGVWVDRVPYRRTIVVADAVRAVLLGALPVLAALGQLRIWHLYVTVTLAGIAALFESIAAQSLTPRLVPRERLLAANSALMLSTATVSTTGSAVGGLLVSALTAPIAIAVDAASFLLSALVKARIRTEGGPRVSGGRGPVHLRADIAEGLRAVFAHRVLRAVVLAATLGAFAGQAQAVVFVLYLVHDLALPAGLIGVLVALTGVAGVAGALVATRVTHRMGPGPTFIAGMFLASAAGLVLAAAGGPFAVMLAVVAVSQVLRGSGPSLYGVNQQTFRQALIPPELLSRANATWRFLAYGGQSLGAVLGGVAGETLGLRATVVVTSCLMLAATGIALASPLRSLRGLPDR